MKSVDVLLFLYIPMCLCAVPFIHTHINNVFAESFNRYFCNIMCYVNNEYK